MEPRKGHYSLIQFCPDRGRAEAVNVGLVLFVPADRRLAVRMATTSKRVQQIFGKGAIDSWWLKTVRESFERGLMTEHRAGRFAVPEDLDRYFSTLGNDIIATPPRPTQVDDARASLDRLYARFVEAASIGAEEMAIPTVVKPLDDAFRRLHDRMAAVQFAQRFSIPGYPHQVQADYVFPNGDANLVRLLRIGESPARAFDQAVKLGGESVVVTKHLRVNDLAARLVVVAAPLLVGARTVDTEAKLASLYHDFPDAEWVPSASIPTFAQRVEAAAH
ncbi:MAG: hypothetical protein CHACPFDD_03181 [Phycisphaerae bacterium]|nr:hypothetical protein [Phycisphaerae bacterium]